MKNKIAVALLIGLSLLTVFYTLPRVMADNGHALTLRVRPPAPPAFFAAELETQRTAPLEVAKVFGRSQGCQDAAPALIELTARTALRAGLNPRIAAATIAVESGCNPFAISSKGALGIMQVVPKVWKSKYDFAGRVNLLNPEDNIRVGTEIMAGLVRQYGTTRGVQLYNGAGVGCDTCDGQYSNKILALAGGSR